MTLQSDKYFFFYKHRLSQWHQVDFVDEHGWKFCCCEQYMMFYKAILFDDPDAAARIMKIKNPKTHQDLGRGVRRFSAKKWDEEKYNIVYNGNLLRFTQSEECWKLLDSTGDKILVEASPVDRVWGVGLGSNDERILDEKNWRGENLLGKVLTQVREELRKKINAKIL